MKKFKVTLAENAGYTSSGFASASSNIPPIQKSFEVEASGFAAFAGGIALQNLNDETIAWFTNVESIVEVK